MIRKRALIALVLSLVTYSPAALASPYGDDLSKCLVRSTTDVDKVTLVKWMFSVISLNTAIKPLVSIDSQQRQAFDSGLASLVQRLLYADCHTEAVLALKYEGRDALSSSFKIFGEVAMQEMMKDPAVMSGLGSFAKDIDTKKMTALFSEAGIKSGSR